VLLNLSLLSVTQHGLFVMMGISQIFKIDDRYASIDQ
jgi:hypothetical protein